MSNLDVLNALRTADPAANTDVTAVDAIAAVRAARRVSSPKRRRLMWAGAAVAVIAIGVPAGAVGSGFAARTGWFGSPNPSTESDATEWLDLGADDLPEVVSSLMPDYLPMAPGVTQESLEARVVAYLAEEDAYGQVTLVVRAYERESYKDWIDVWIAANDSGDISNRDRAAEVLTEASGWPAVVSTDGGGFVNIMKTFALRISAGDEVAAQALAQYEGASAWDGIDRRSILNDIIEESRGAQG